MSFVASKDNHEGMFFIQFIKLHLRSDFGIPLSGPVLGRPKKDSKDNKSMNTLIALTE